MRTLVLYLLVMLASLPVTSQMLTKWNRDFYPNSSTDLAHIACDPVGNTYVSYSTWGTRSIWIEKLDPSGFPIWSRQLGFNLPYESGRPSDIFFHNDHLWVISLDLDPGVNDYNMFVRKIDTAGNQIMQFTYRLPNSEYVIGSHLLPNDDLLIAIDENSNPFYNPLHLLCYAAGDSVLLWDHILNPNELSSGYAKIAHDLLGNIFLCYESIYGNTRHSYVQKLTPSGDTIWRWQQPYGIASTTAGFSPDGRSLVAIIPSNGSMIDYVHIDSSGNVIFQTNSYGLYHGWAIDATSDNGWLLSGISAGHATIVKIDSMGLEMWRVIAPDNYSGIIFSYGGFYTSDSSRYCSVFNGSNVTQSNGQYIYTVEIDADGNFIDMTTIGSNPNNLDQFSGFDAIVQSNGDLSLFLSRSDYGLGSAHKLLYRYCTSECASNLRGKVYVDFDQNCSQSISEPGFPYAMLEIDQGARTLVASNLGTFDDVVESGQHSLETHLSAPYSISCPGVPYQFTIDSLHPAAFNLEFGVYADSNHRDLAIDLGFVGIARAGFAESHVFNVRNVAIRSDSGVVLFQMDSIFQFVSANPTPDSIDGNRYFWKLDQLQAFQQHRFVVETTIPIGVTTGTSFINSAEVTSYSIDADLTNNKDTLVDDVRGSFDPNHKSVDPPGIAQNGSIAPEDSVLTYTIQFQNVGNDTAFTVAIRDSISPLLDLASMQVLNATHNWEMQLYNSRTVVWTFQNILLPDSASDPLHSQGMIKYRIETLPGLPIGSTIRNRADIFFDYNAPVATNTVSNTIANLVSNDAYINQLPPASELTIFPNPCHNLLNIMIPEARTEGNITVYDGIGRIVLNLKVPPRHSFFEINTTFWPSGIYYIAMNSRNGASIKKVIRS